SSLANNPVIRVDPNGKIIPLIAAYLVRKVLVEGGKRFIWNFLLDATAQFAGNIIKENDYSWEGVKNAFNDVDWWDATCNGVTESIKFDANTKFKKVMKVAIPVLSELLKAGIDYKAMSNDPTFNKIRTIMTEKGYSAGDVTGK